MWWQVVLKSIILPFEICFSSFHLGTVRNKAGRQSQVFMDHDYIEKTIKFGMIFYAWLRVLLDLLIEQVERMVYSFDLPSPFMRLLKTMEYHGCKS